MGLNNFKKNLLIGAACLDGRSGSAFFMQLKTKILLAMAAIFLVHFLAVGYVGLRQIKADVIEDIRDQARTVRGMLMSLRNVYQKQFVVHNIPINEQTLGLLPSHSISRISEEFRLWVETGLSFNNVSDYPYNPKNRADKIELEAMAWFRGHDDQKERFVPYVKETGEPYYHFSQPIWFKPRCLKCHGEEESVPSGIRERYPERHIYEIGDLRGVMSIKLPAQVIEVRVATQLQQNALIHLSGFVIAFLLLSWLLNRTVLAPISIFKKVARQVALGDYSARSALSGQDEIAEVSRTFDNMALKIGERERALSVQKALNAALSQTNKAIIRVDTPDLLYENVCRIAVEYGNFKFAWIGVVDAEMGEIRLAASAGKKIQLGHTALSLDPEDEFGKSPIARAVRANSPVIIHNFSRRVEYLPSFGMPQGDEIGSAAIFPIRDGDRVAGVFCLYAETAYYIDSAIQALLAEMASDVEFAIQNYRQTEAGRVAHWKLEESTKQLAKLNNQMSLLLESTGEGIFGVDSKGLCSFVNQAAMESCGYSREEMLGMPMQELAHQRLSDEALYPDNESAITQALTTGKYFRDVEEVFWRKDGTSFPVEYSSYPIHENGQVTGAVTVFRDVTERNELNQRMNFLAMHDPLTRLMNRYAFDKKLKKLIEQARHSNTEHALCYMDLDQFKVVNDTCGHVAGDAMLQMLAQLLQTTLRQSDTLARLGGDEFGLLLEGCSLEQAYLICKKVCSEVKASRFSWEGKNIAAGMSIGVVSIAPETVSAQKALSQADAACYVAKDMGRNRVHVYREFDEAVARRQGEMKWVSEIQSAMEEGRLSLHFQPIKQMDHKGGLENHFEILLRMKGSDGQQISPGSFIPAAERYNMMGSLDRWVIKTAFQWLVENPARLNQIGTCAINLSGQSLGDGNLHEFIIEERRRYQLPAEKICFEVTETAAVSSLDQAIHFMSLLRKLGFRFALDDFGTGMSSFEYLKNMPVDFLKIDGSFVKDILNDPVDRAMVDSINRIGHLMGLETIAEYVESQKILEELRIIGVDYAQGYGIAKPEPLKPETFI